MSSVDYITITVYCFISKPVMNLLADELELLGQPSTSPTWKELRKALQKKSNLFLPEKHPSSPNAHLGF